MLNVVAMFYLTCIVTGVGRNESETDGVEPPGKMAEKQLKKKKKRSIENADEGTSI